MDFVKILRSVEELLYEAISWLVFYPLTLWRCIWKPGELTLYTKSELGDRSEEQFTENVSPPLFLMLSVLLAHAIELSFGLKIDASLVTTAGARFVTSNDQNLLAFRSFLFALFPLVMAVGMLRRQGLPITRETLRAPFYLQCYIAAPFCLFLSTGGILLRNPRHSTDAIGIALTAIAIIWYIWAETRMFRRELGLSQWKATFTALWLLLVGAVLSVLVATITVLA